MPATQKCGVGCTAMQGVAARYARALIPRDDLAFAAMHDRSFRQLARRTAQQSRSPRLAMALRRRRRQDWGRPGHGVQAASRGLRDSCCHGEHPMHCVKVTLTQFHHASSLRRLAARSSSMQRARGNAVSSAATLARSSAAMAGSAKTARVCPARPRTRFSARSGFMSGRHRAQPTPSAPRQITLSAPTMAWAPRPRTCRRRLRPG